MYLVFGVNFRFLSMVPQWMRWYVFLPVFGLIVGGCVLAYWYPWLVWIVTCCFPSVFGGLPVMCVIHCF